MGKPPQAYWYSWFATNPRRSKRQWCGSHVGWQNVLFSFLASWLKIDFEILMNVMINKLWCYLCTGQIEASTFSPPPPQAYTGHLTALTFTGVGNLIPMHKGWGIWSLASMSCDVSRCMYKVWKVMGEVDWRRLWRGNTGGVLGYVFYSRTEQFWSPYNIVLYITQKLYKIEWLIFPGWGHLNSYLARGGGNLNTNFSKIQMPGGRMLKLWFDRYITNKPLTIVINCFIF